MEGVEFGFSGREVRLLFWLFFFSPPPFFFFFSPLVSPDSEGCPSSVDFGFGKLFGEGEGFFPPPFPPFFLSDWGFFGLNGQRTMDLGSPRDMVRNSEESPNILGGLFTHRVLPKDP